jgi:tellurite resistance protein
MPKRYTRLSATTAEHLANYLDTRDEDVMRGLVTAGAFVALADGRAEKAERDELVSFVDRQQFVPTMSKTVIAEIFDQRTRQLEDRNSAEVIIENLRPLAGLSLASVVLRTAERVAAADRQIHPCELQALELLRLIMTDLSAKGLPSRSRACDGGGCESNSDASNINEHLTERVSGSKLRWPYQGATIRRLALNWSSRRRKQVSFAVMVVAIVGWAISSWVISNVAAGGDVIQSNENSSTFNPYPRIQLDSHHGVDVIEPKDELLPMFNPYLPFRILDPVY